jgi:hypothetical protein
MQARDRKSTSRSPSFNLAERFEYGNFTIPEIRELKNRSHTGFYQDVQRGLVSIEKIGTKSIIRGPVARRYIEGRPLDDGC